MPQIIDPTIVKPNPFFKVATYRFNDYFALYTKKTLSTINYIVLEPEYSNLDLSVTEFDPLSYFKKSFVLDIFNNSVCVLFDCTIEGSHIDFPYFKNFLKSFESRNINFSNFFYLTGDAIEKTIYSQYSNLYHINTLDSFFKDVKVTGEIKKSKTYFFSCLNRKPRYWRSKLIYIIQQDDFLRSKSLCSHPKIYSKNEISDHTGFDVEDEMGNFFVNLPELQASTEHPLEINMTFNNVISHLPEVFSEVAFDLCMESYQEGIHIHNTEKIFKPMVNSIPLLIWGTPGVNTNQLSNIGFKTYEDWFDLSFDSELDTEKRLHLLVKEVRRVCNMLASYNDEQLLEWQNKNTSVIEHNKMTVLNQLPMNKIEFNRLFEDLGRA